MNKTIYVRDEDVEMWERARELAGEKLSPVIASTLRRFVADKEAEIKGFERIEVRYNDSDRHGIPTAKAFYGKWIFSSSKPLYMSDDPHSRDAYAVATTAKGAAVIYSWSESEDGDGEYRANHKFAVYPSLEEAARDSRVNWAATQAIEKIGVPVEELDI